MTCMHIISTSLCWRRRARQHDRHAGVSGTPAPRHAGMRNLPTVARHAGKPNSAGALPFNRSSPPYADSFVQHMIQYHTGTYCACLHGELRLHGPMADCGPTCASSRQASSLRSSVFPTPLGPVTNKISPDRIANEISLNKLRSPNARASDNTSRCREVADILSQAQRPISFTGVWLRSYINRTFD